MDERSVRVEKLFEVPMLVAALLVIPVIASSNPRSGDPWPTVAPVANWLIWLAFLAEVAVMPAVVPDPTPLASGAPARGRDRRPDAAVSPGEPAGASGLPSAPARPRPGRRPLRPPAVTLDGVRYAMLVAVLTVLAGGAAFAAAEGRDVSTWDSVLTLVIGAVSQRFVATEVVHEVDAAEREVEADVDPARAELLDESA